MDDTDGEEIYDISEGQRATGNDNADMDANDLDEVRNMLEVMRGGVVEDATITGDVLQKIHDTFSGKQGLHERSEKSNCGFLILTFSS